MSERWVYAETTHYHNDSNQHMELLDGSSENVKDYMVYNAMVWDHLEDDDAEKTARSEAGIRAAIKESDDGIKAVFYGTDVNDPEVFMVLSAKKLADVSSVNLDSYLGHGSYSAPKPNYTLWEPPEETESPDAADEFMFPWD